MRAKPKYWIVWDGTYSHVVFSKREPREDCGGPYDTFSAAKREVVSYYRNRIWDAKHSLREILRLKKTDVKEEP